MKFSKATSILFFCASAVTARSLPIDERRSAAALPGEILPKDISVASAVDLDRRDALAEPEALPVAAAEEVHDLVSRDSYSAEILQYLRAIETKHISGPAKWPSQWKDLHGDGKSAFDGKYVCQVKKSGGTYEARVVAHKKLSKTIKTGHVFKTTTIPKAFDKKGREIVPTYGRAVHFLRVAFGG
ncbi:hypothetical protein E4U21_004324 [Claviceps maximensis]|nr:hypothetical protein E4U21_004324 [Claviceps maximensis]